MNRVRLGLIAVLVACGEPSPTASIAVDAELPPADEPCHETLEADQAATASIYDLDVELVDHDGRTVAFDTYRGGPVLVSMMYSSCTSACPMLIQKVQAIESGLDPAVRARSRVLLISLDPARDDPTALRALASQHGVDLARWTLAAPPADRVRDIAAVLGIRYREQPNGEFNHSSVIALVDGDGRIASRIEGLGSDAGVLSEQIAKIASDPRAAAPVPQN